MTANNQLSAIYRSSLFFVALFCLIILQSSCGGGNKESKSGDATDSTDASAYTPSTASSSYDPNKIDATAPIMNLQLDALGNSMDVMSFSTEEIHVKAGTTVKLHFKNTATDQAMKHNFFIVKVGTMEQVATASMAAGADKNYIPDDKTNILYTSKILEPASEEDLIFAAPPIGNYQFVCTYPGHWQKMNGKFIVE